MSKENTLIDETPIYHPFRLPITFVKKERLHTLTKNVMEDLELNTSINKNIFPSDKDSRTFGNLTREEWSKQITTDVSFLKDTQNILIDITKQTNDKDKNKQDASQFFAIWDDVHDKHFLEKYYYMDWPQLTYLNKSSKFLQCITVANVLSPLLSLCIPLFIIIIPFIILKIKGINIDMNKYIQVLKETAGNHFIGKSILNMESLSWDKFIYLIITFVVYVFQIYQNTTTCFKYYKNVKKINENLLYVKNYISSTINKMESFVLKHKSKRSYYLFCQEVEKHSNQLKPFLQELSIISEFQHTIKKSSEVGYMLKCYHELMNNDLYSTSIRFSMGFEGYLENMMALSNHIKSGKMSLATFNLSKETSIQKQFYPLTKEKITNNVTMKNNIIITGPNASGKTTLIKTTTVNIIVSQQIGCGFYTSCSLHPYHYIHSYINIPDTSERDSLFQAESRRCKDILDIIDTSLKHYRHFCIFDELYSGTNPIEANKAGYAFLSYLTKYENIDFILTTHYIDMCERIKKENKSIINDKKNKKKIINYKMNVNEKDDQLEYTYKMMKGISYIQGAIHVFKSMDYPKEILNLVRCSL